MFWSGSESAVLSMCSMSKAVIFLVENAVFVAVNLSVDSKFLLCTFL